MTESKPRMTVATHPKWFDAERRLRLLSDEHASLTARQDHLSEQLKQRPAGAAAAAADAWESTVEGGVATLPRIDTVTLREEFQANGRRLEVILAAQRLGSDKMFRYLDGSRPLQVDLSVECCRSAAPEYLDAIRHVHAAAMALDVAMQCADAILTSLENGSTLIVDPLRRIWGPIGDVRGENNPLSTWLKDLARYLADLQTASNEAKE